jgi:DNA mismatch endonuclease (patch repair protein)
LTSRHSTYTVRSYLHAETYYPFLPLSGSLTSGGNNCKLHGNSLLFWKWALVERSSSLVRALQLFDPLMDKTPVKPPNKHLLIRSTSAYSRRMAGRKSKNTAPELLVRSFLHAAGFRYRLYSSHLPGRPDIVLPKYKAVVFVQGCFWHWHGTDCLCKRRESPRINTDFWRAKFAYNQDRDQRNQQILREAGWRVLVVWECELKPASRGATLAKLTADLLRQEMEWEYLLSA